jgi:urea carboxylase-associated protein 2
MTATAPHAAMQHEETPAFYRQRYMELKAQAETLNARRPPPDANENPASVPANRILTEEIVPGFWYWTHAIARGHALRLVNDFAAPGVSVLLWNADDPTERYNPADSVKVQWTSRLTRGKVVLASVTADTCGLHDSIAGGSTPESNRRKYGQDGRYRNTRDNFLLAAGKHGLGPRDVGPCTTFFAPVVTDAAGRFVWRQGKLKPGDYVDLRAEMNLIVALSNCPHPLSPGSEPDARPVRAVIWRPEPAPPNDLCRTASEEAARAFENNEAALRR